MPLQIAAYLCVTAAGRFWTDMPLQSVSYPCVLAAAFNLDHFALRTAVVARVKAAILWLDHSTLLDDGLMWLHSTGPFCPSIVDVACLKAAGS
ncbi:hypothetical protein LXL04_023272 [Taraxacum kok-saghyz]